MTENIHENNELVNSILIKSKYCGSPSATMCNKKSRSTKVVHSTCKKNYLCDYCAKHFQTLFCIGANKLGHYVLDRNEANQKTFCFFLTLSYKRVAVSELKFELEKSTKALTKFLRIRLQPQTAEPLFCKAMEEYRYNLLTSDRFTDQEIEQKLSMQEKNFDQFCACLPEKDARFRHITPKMLIRLEIKQMSDTEVFPHFHILISSKSYLPKPLINHLWAQCAGNDGCCFIEDMNSKERLLRAAFYCAKYSSKAEGKNIYDREVAAQVQACLYRKPQRRWAGHDKTKLFEEKQAENVWLGRVDRSIHLKQPDCENDEISVGQLFEVVTRKGDRIKFIFTSTEVKEFKTIPKSRTITYKDTYGKQQTKTITYDQQKIEETFQARCDVSETDKEFYVFFRCGFWTCKPHSEIDEIKVIKYMLAHQLSEIKRQDNQSDQNENEEKIIEQIDEISGKLLQNSIKETTYTENESREFFTRYNKHEQSKFGF